MLTLFHAPNSRSTSIVALIHELGVADRVGIREVTIPRQDGSGGRDPSNPHPEGKVPVLLADGEMVRERGAIVLYLTDRFPAAKLGPLPGEAKRGAYLSWLFYYQGVLEPVALLHAFGITHPALQATFRDFDTMIGEIEAALREGPYLLGEAYSAADLLMASPFAWFPQMAEGSGAIRDWVARCQDRDGIRTARERDNPGA